MPASSPESPPYSASRAVAQRGSLGSRPTSLLSQTGSHTKAVLHAKLKDASGVSSRNLLVDVTRATRATESEGWRRVGLVAAYADLHRECSRIASGRHVDASNCEHADFVLSMCDSEALDAVGGRILECVSAAYDVTGVGEVDAIRSDLETFRAEDVEGFRALAIEVWLALMCAPGPLSVPITLLKDVSSPDHLLHTNDLALLSLRLAACVGDTQKLTRRLQTLGPDDGFLALGYVRDEMPAEAECLDIEEALCGLSRAVDPETFTTTVCVALFMARDSHMAPGQGPEPGGSPRRHQDLPPAPRVPNKIRCAPGTMQEEGSFYIRYV